VTIDRLLAEARRNLMRLKPHDAAEAVRAGARLVDTRPEYQRRADGDIPGAIVIERNHLEWRLDPRSDARIPEAAHHHIRWIVICDEGYSSSLAAASLQALGLVHATDVIGGFQEWRAAGLPVTHTLVRPRLARLDLR
jgi:rhodanese-related sulfurtransferase